MTLEVTPTWLAVISSVLSIVSIVISGFHCACRRGPDGLNFRFSYHKDLPSQAEHIPQP